MKTNTHMGRRTLISCYVLAAVALIACSNNNADKTANGNTEKIDNSGSVSKDSPSPTAIRPHDYIRNAGFSRLVIELDRTPSLKPRADVESELVSGFTNLLDKPMGIEVVRDSSELPEVGESGVWTFSQLQALAKTEFNLSVDNNTVSIHTMWLDGRYEKSGVLGIAWGNRYLAIFADVIADSCNNGLPTFQDSLCKTAEISVWTHEVGHVIGLVNNGIAMVEDHQDPERGAHDHSDECVMYWAYEGAGVFDVLQSRITSGNANALGFDAKCKQDLEAIRKAPSDG